MAKKKSAAASASSAGRKTLVSKVIKQDTSTENSKLDQKATPTPQLPQSSTHTQNQRRKGSLAALRDDETTPKRQNSFKPNPDSPIVISSDDERPVSRAGSAEVILIADYAEAKKEEGNIQFKLGKFTDAIKLYSQAIDLDGDNPAYLSNRAAAFMALGNYQSALNDMEIVNSSKFLNLGIQPSVKNSIRLIRCLLPLGKFYQARQTFNQLFKEHPNSDEIKKEESRLKSLEFLLNSIQQHRKDQRWTMLLLGLVALEKELDCGSLKVKEWLIWKVEALCGQKKWEEAKSLCSDLVRSYSSDPEVLYYRAKVMYYQGNLSATVAHCQEAMRFDPDFRSARDLLRQAKSIESLKESGNTSFKASDFETAIKKYLEASSIDPTNESIVMTLDSNRAQALLKRSKNGEAIEICNKILKVDSQHFKALRTRARAKKAGSEFEAAMFDFESAAKLAPSSKEKTEILNDIQATKIMISRGKYVDHYKVLGVAKNASDDEIKKAFRKKSLIHHPDKGGNEEKFKELKESYMVLKDSQSRAQFDRVDPDNPEGFFNRRASGFSSRSNADNPFSWDDLFTGVSNPRRNSHFSQHSHAHAYQSSSSFFSTSNGF